MSMLQRLKGAVVMATHVMTSLTPNSEPPKAFQATSRKQRKYINTVVTAMIQVLSALSRLSAVHFPTGAITGCLKKTSHNLILVLFTCPRGQPLPFHRLSIQLSLESISVVLMACSKHSQLSSHRLILRYNVNPCTSVACSATAKCPDQQSQAC